MTTTLNVKTLSHKEVKSYILAIVFIAANVLLPQLFHLVNFGGTTFLPILLFTLVASATYGITSGIITAIVSPLVSMAIFGMPSPEMTIILISKGLTLALVLGYIANKLSKISIYTIIISIVAYQAIGFVITAALINSETAISLLLVSYPAVILQLIGGYLLIKMLSK